MILMIIKELFTSLKEITFDLLFPLKCSACGKETEDAFKNKLICSDCLKKLRPSLEFYCPNCRAKSIDGGLCFSCTYFKKSDFYLDKLFYPYLYNNKRIQGAIKAFKYNFIKNLDSPLAKLVINYLEKIKGKLQLNDCLVIPIPLHRIRFNQRGYNQAELIAKKISDFFGFDFCGDCLIKKKKTKDQVELKEEKRKENLKGVFECIKKDFVFGRKILLIDDVYTTGATMIECARVLKENGAKEVIGLVIARG